MHTLYHPNILSPTPRAEPQQNPFELLFPSTANTNSTASASSQSSYETNGLLTRRLQVDRSVVDDDTRNVEVKPYTRRKGHPKLLLMGQRRYYSLSRCAIGRADRDSDLANLRSRM